MLQNATRTWIDGPDTLVTCETATFSWGDRLGAGPYLVSSEPSHWRFPAAYVLTPNFTSVYDARPTTGGLPVTSYTINSTGITWKVAYPPGTHLLIL